LLSWTGIEKKEYRSVIKLAGFSYATLLIVMLITPAGVLALTVSPTRLFQIALPIGDWTEMTEYLPIAAPPSLTIM